MEVNQSYHIHGARDNFILKNENVLALRSSMFICSLKESGLVTMNHHYEVDWLFGWMGADNYRVLGNSRSDSDRVFPESQLLDWFCYTC